MKKLFLLLVVVACVAAFFLFKSASDDPDLKKKESQNSTVSLERGLLRVVVETTGQVVPNQEIEIKCKASGEVVKLPVDISDSVSTGDLLVQLDPEKEQRQLEQTEVNLTISKARLQKAQLELEIAIAGLKNETTRTSSALDSTKIKVQEAKARLQRTRDLNARKLTTPEELERAQSASAQAQSDLVGASVRVDDLKTREFQIRSRQEDVKIAEAQVLSNELSLSDAKERLTDTRVLSPIDGVVAERLVQVGQIIASGINNVGGGTKVLSLVDLSRMFIHASVDESDIGRVKTDQRARISVDAYPGQKFRGTVRRVATKGEIVSNVVTFEVRIEVEGRGKSLLKPEMTANLEIIALEREDVALLPAESIRRRKGEPFVMVETAEGKTETRAIQIGDTDGKMVEIISGLSQAEKVLFPESGSQSRWARDEQSRAKRNQARSARIGMRALGGGRRR